MTAIVANGRASAIDSPRVDAVVDPAAAGASGTAWTGRRGELARFSLDRLVVRPDAYVQARIRTPPEWTMSDHVYNDANLADFPEGSRLDRYSVDAPLHVGLLSRHFAGEWDTDNVAIYVSRIDDDAEVCLIGVLDVDHDGSEEGRRAALAKTLELETRCRSVGLHVLLEDSGGGFHLWLRWAEPVPCADLFRLLWEIRSQHLVATDVDGQRLLVELFPGGPGIRGIGREKGSAIRLPGRKPGTDHWSTFGNDGQFVGGEAGIGLLLGWPSNPVETLPEALEAIRDRPWRIPLPAGRQAPAGDVGHLEHGSTPAGVVERRYIEAVLRGCCEEIAAAVTCRNNVLFARSCRVGSFLHYDAIDPREAYGRLWEAAERCLVATEEPAKSSDTLRRGLERGMQSPQFVPGVPGPGEDVAEGGVEAADGDAEPERERPRRGGGFPAFRNYDSVRVDAGRTCRAAVDQRELFDRFYHITGGWPKRAAAGLFHYDPGRDELVDIVRPNQLYAWAGDYADIDFAERLSGCVGWEKFCERVRLKADRYDAVERAPHFPPIGGIYYAHPPLPESGDGTTLEGLLDFFAPATPLDRVLLRLLLVTLVWGGRPGQRPAFLIEGPEDDARRGRGVGKTSVAETLALVVGGALSGVDPGGGITKVEEKIINDETRKRVLLIDNLKTERLSWAGLESLITKATITARRNYLGTETRPNLLTVVITVNGAALCEDMAQRVVVVRVGRPESMRIGGEAWSDAVARYIEENRGAILADLRSWLDRPRAEFAPEVRPGSWSVAVLSRCDDPGEVARLILRRREEINDDVARSSTFEDQVATLIARHYPGVSPRCTRVRLSLEVAAWVYSRATGEPVGPTGVTKKLNLLQLRRLRFHRTSQLRGWIWTGEDVGALNHDELHHWNEVPRDPGGRPAPM